MDLLFFALGVIDIVAGGILFVDPSAVVKVVGVVMLGKGILTIFKCLSRT
jgi:uncharacterized membrane protein HdeD (DUF308 family)